MPSLFSCARTASTPSKSKHKAPPASATLPLLPSLPGTPTGEFGQQQVFYTGGTQYGPGGGQYQSTVATAPLGRARCASLPPAGLGEAGYGAVGFLPTTLPADLNTPWASAPSQSQSLSASTGSRPASSDVFGSSSGTPVPPRPPYGSLSPAHDAVLGLGNLVRLVAVLCAELERTGVATPFVFSALALDVRRAGARVVRAFLASCDASGSGASPRPCFRRPR
jgi:hypothetical protein